MNVVSRVGIAGLAAAGLAALSGPVASRSGAATIHSSAHVSVPCGWATSAPPVTWDHVVWIIFENKSRTLLFDKYGDLAPYLSGLRDRCGEAADMAEVRDLSLPNYIAMTSGYPGYPTEITTNAGPGAWPQRQPSLFEQAGDWRELSEDMPENCYLKKPVGYWTVNHTPAQFYTRIRTGCRTRAVPLTDPPAIGARFTVIIPNKVHIMHRTDVTPTIPDRIAAGDAWTSTFLPKLLSSPEYAAGKMAIFLTWDEATVTPTDNVPFIVVSPYTTPGTVSTRHYDHYSLLKSTEQLLGISSYLGHAGDPGVMSFRTDFRLR